MPGGEATLIPVFPDLRRSTTYVGGVRIIPRKPLQKQRPVIHTRQLYEKAPSLRADR